jgi:RES domain-containing protein
VTPAVVALAHDLTVWRLVAEKHVSEAFSGEGAQLYGGRWNRKGAAMVYTAATRSLAILEMLVQASPLPKYTAIPATLPAGLSLAVFDENSLPPDRRDMPPSESLRTLGGAWIAAGETCALRVPSAVVPAECNFLLNPAHPDFGKIRIGAPERLSMDRRLL